jgi:hypothetical protein
MLPWLNALISRVKISTALAVSNFRGIYKGDIYIVHLLYFIFK